MINAGINKIGFFTLLTLLGVALIPIAQAGNTDEDNSEKAILERIKPVGNVCIKGQTCDSNTSTSESGGAETTDVSPAAGAVETVAASDKLRSGESIYKLACSGCHGAAAVAMGAPRQGNAGDWEPRLAKGGKDQLLANAVKGLNAMPPKGTCMDCSDKELAAAIDYMISASL